MKAIELKDLISMLAKFPDETLNRINVCVALHKNIDNLDLDTTHFIDPINVTVIAEGSMPPKLIIHCKDE